MKEELDEESKRVIEIVDFNYLLVVPEYFEKLIKKIDNAWFKVLIRLAELIISSTIYLKYIN